MKRLAITLLIFLVLAGLGWYLYTQRDISSRFVVITPSDGEVWWTGEEHAITWNVGDVPENYMVSISIRRIPPPPLQEVGQEFDPVIFVNLPNTGNATWKIHPMYPSGTYILTIHAYDSLPATNEISIESEEFNIVRPKLNEGVYPLYPEVSWQTLEAETVTIGEEILVGASFTSDPVDAGMNPSNVFAPFESYYKNKLTELGWTVRNDLAAGGPVGGQTGYAKNSKTILIRYHTNFQNVTETAPSECPCDVTLSIFSTE